jgi:4-hydroxy-4-methyl-2-oxoglutarate aldolase
MGGGTKLARLHYQGLAGVLTDGRLRDFAELRGYDFAAYCAGEATHWGGDLVTPYQANVPVVLSRVGVLPGSYVFADDSGTAVIPAAEVEQVLDGAPRRGAGRRGLSREDRARAARGGAQKARAARR